ncbi:hypothetical protein [Streptomyces sp. NBC_00557]|uniref:hypothetical protein n=1 Tax=Streptomyces sp. NBC_00557 TaxID=2975776 RepID=UPI002E800945|nr:hypothetical protein [Streptomyces sp. NBC_00557]WUC35640.1 hypothetical protein OG956_16115 [Streptomyces sp. NBC_00557]
MNARARASSTPATDAGWTVHNAAAKIGAISPALCRPVGDEGGTYGLSVDKLESMPDLPWGTPVARTYDRWSLDWWGHGIKSWAWDGIVKDSIWGGFVGLGTFEDNLLGVNGSDAQHQTWDGLKRIVAGTYAYGMDAVGEGDHLSDWQRDSKAYAKEFGKQFIAYDMQEKDPARAHAVTSFNILTLFAGAGGALARLGKAGRFAEAASAVAKVGDALDPISGAARAARTLSDLPKVSEVLTNVSEHLKLPKTRFPDGALDDLSNRYRVDKNGRLIPINADGTPNLAEAPHEPAAGDRVVPARPDDRGLVGVGGRAPEATLRGSDRLPPHASHETGGGGGDRLHGSGGGSAGEAGSAGGGADHPGAASHGSGEGPSHGGSGHHGEVSSGHMPPESAHGDPHHGEAPGADGHSTPDNGGSAHGDIPGIDRARYGTREGEYAQAHTGPIRPEQEAGVLDELKRAKMDSRDQEAVIRSLRKDPYGAGVAELINRGHLRGSENYKGILDMCKKGPTKRDPKESMVPAAYMALRYATELQDRGFTHLGFELGDHTTTYDIDVYTRHPDGTMDYGYQLKDVDTIDGIKKAARKSASQLDYPMSHRVAILDVHASMADLTPRMFEEVVRFSRRSNATYLLRFEDGAITYPPDGPVFP